MLCEQLGGCLAYSTSGMGGSAYYAYDIDAIMTCVQPVISTSFPRKSARTDILVVSRPVETSKIRHWASIPLDTLMRATFRHNSSSVQHSSSTNRFQRHRLLRVFKYIWNAESYTLLFFCVSTNSAVIHPPTLNSRTDTQPRSRQTSCRKFNRQS